MPQTTETPETAETDAWVAYLEDTLALSIGDTDRASRLATICLSASTIVRAASTDDVGLPPARPASTVVREAASELLRTTRGPLDTVLGLVGRHWKIEREDPDDAERRADFDRAAVVAREAGDHLTETWVLVVATSEYVRTQRTATADRYAFRAVEAFESATPGLGPIAATDHVWPGLATPDSVTAVIELFARDVAVRATRRTGRVSEWDAAIDAMKAVALRLVSERPTLLVMTLGQRATYERATGDQADLTEMRELSERNVLLRGKYLQHEASNAEARGDYDSALMWHRRRMDARLAPLRPDLVGAPARTLTAAFRDLSVSERRRLNAVANPAFEMSSSLILSGRTVTTAADAKAAVEWLDLADVLWAGWGKNGLMAVRFNRHRLAPGLTGTAVADLLDISRTAGRPGLRVSAVVHAALYGESRLARVVERLDEMLDEKFTSLDRARLLTARSWLTRPGERTADPQSRLDAAEALDLMPARPATRLRDIARAAWVLALCARDDDEPEAERAALEEAVIAAGRLVLNATTFSQRSILAADWSVVIRRALDFAREHDDAALADLAAEVARRDSVGVLLANASSEAGAPAEVVDAALAVQTAGRAGEVDDQQDASAESEPIDPEADELMRSGIDARVVVKARAAYASAERLLGPIGSLMDPRTLYEAGATDLLRELPKTQPTFILQLLPSTLAMVGHDQNPRLYRRLTWLEDGEPAEYLDYVRLWPGLLTDTALTGEDDWLDGTPFLPDPLVEALETATADEPLRLLVVASGLFHICFDALEIGGGLRLIDRALTTVHTSLAGVRYMLANPRSGGEGSVAILDEDTFGDTSFEKESLERWFPVTRGVASRSELDNPYLEIENSSVFVMGVHGGDDANGWHQVKILPSGESMTAAEALNYRYPALCVLASCNSQMRLGAGVDLSGFPTALFARGARTVIGSVGGIYSLPTALIMSRFYADLHETGNPVVALRTARLRWLSENPTRHDEVASWGRLVIYGGAQY
ncbi:CHAT domain-containing protein [Rathayibacter oskolensis]|uniref:CHAT domain-containing protein n=1 Tax=Rathayibacter oskolensis TaxID=1891671 RepID=A0A1X7PEQ4_9MICO|nr:CHAT domain-containing protein [Rathayibacter oskolensis]SMH49328.1 CHAT domain-containing protein [Rathayibacter oskolensis]